MKNKNIKVKCIEGYEEFQNNEEKTLLAVIEEGKEYDAVLYEETDEYFAKDKEGREFYVGEIDIEGDLIISDEFVLVEKNKVYDISEYRK